MPAALAVVDVLLAADLDIDELVRNQRDGRLGMAALEGDGAGLERLRRDAVARQSVAGEESVPGRASW